MGSYTTVIFNRLPQTLGMNQDALNRIDSVANAAIEKGAMPGCVVLVAKDGKIAYHKAFGYTNFDKKNLLLRIWYMTWHRLPRSLPLRFPL
jgi:CubicO group peptidase (beta-lactamase class C family)